MSRSAIRFVAPVLVSLLVMLIAGVVSIEVLSTMRAWVGGESLYSKGQKNATYYLAQYALTRSDADYRQYQLAIAFPLGDRQARLALQRHPPDLAAAHQGFLRGGSDPADIDSIILLFRLFGRAGPVRHAIDVWTAGDSYSMQLCAIAARLHPADGSEVPADERQAIETELNRINGELTPLSAQFSATLGDIARLTRTLLVIALTVGTIITALLCIRVTRARVRERNAKEQGLARLTELYAALSQTSQLISRVGDRGKLFEELCRICVGTSGLMLAAVGLVKPERIGFEFVARHGKHAEHLGTLLAAQRPGTPPGADALHLTLRSGRSSVLNRRGDSAGLILSEAAFPLRCQNQLVGVLCVFSQDKQYFEKDIVELMEQLAMEASFALDTLHRDAERRRQSSMLADQNRLLSLIASGADLPTIFTSLALFAEAQCGRICSLVALDVEGTRCSLAVAPSLSRGFELALAQGASADRQEPCFQAIRSGAPVVISDLQVFPADTSFGQLVREARLRSVTAWPIAGNKGQAIGALALYARSDAEAMPLDERLVGICTSVAGIAIESCWAAERIRHLAHHDELTGLPNRLLFGYQLPQALARAHRSGQQVGVFFIDLDRFKVINDTLGHDAGDHVLRQMGMHLQECVRATDTLARVGGDEFALIVEQFNDLQELNGIAQKLLTAMSRPLRVATHEYRLSGSIGVAVYPKDGSDSSSLLKNADIAMYRAKASGKNTYQFYADDIDVHSVDRLTLESELRQALDRREIEVHYQPKVDIGSGIIAGAEALVRWRHPVRGMLLPSEFIFVAEEMGLIADLGNLVLETVCSQLMQWRAQRLPVTRVAMNLSAQQFADTRLVENLNRVLRDTGCDPHLLEFEITESVVMTNPERALHLLEKIKGYGITLAIDDFGTGHSSLAYLKRFPVDSIKIDYAFVRDIAADPNDLAITKAIIALGHSLELKVVAEGVETARQLDILRRFQCDEFQGFLFSGALPAESFTNLLVSNVEAHRADPSYLSDQELWRLG
ncbi:MAG: EAL domain-containing protein [Steroidobacteraceae bacterium]